MVIEDEEETLVPVVSVDSALEILLEEVWVAIVAVKSVKFKAIS